MQCVDSGADFCGDHGFCDKYFNGQEYCICDNEYLGDRCECSMFKQIISFQNTLY